MPSYTHFVKKKNNPKYVLLLFEWENYLCNIFSFFRYDDNKIGVKAVWLRHRIPSYGFVIHEKPVQGK